MTGRERQPHHVVIRHQNPGRHNAVRRINNIGMLTGAIEQLSHNRDSLLIALVRSMARQAAEADFKAEQDRQHHLDIRGEPR